ncbi:MAG: hypothetical protein HQL38_03180 [Alphaproteobacteria bacterium]|nr:hypothetical protein [Alphaproteobacteria bacterium]
MTIKKAPVASFEEERKWRERCRESEARFTAMIGPLDFTDPFRTSPAARRDSTAPSAPEPPEPR